MMINLQRSLSILITKIRQHSVKLILDHDFFNLFLILDLYAWLLTVFILPLFLFLVLLILVLDSITLRCPQASYFLIH
jgi:hypothetical protein